MVASFSWADAYDSVNKDSLPDIADFGLRDDLSASDNSKGYLGRGFVGQRLYGAK